VGLVAKKKTDSASSAEDNTGGGGSGGSGIDIAGMIQRGVAAEMERQRLHTLQVTAEGKKAILTTEAAVGTPRRRKDDKD
jgi:hypothetical protein